MRQSFYLPAGCNFRDEPMRNAWIWLVFSPDHESCPGLSGVESGTLHACGEAFTEKVGMILSVACF